MLVIDAWWQKNRSSAPDLFLEELSAAFDALRSVPLSGHVVRIRGIAGIRRILLRSTRHHVYYQVSAETVTVLAVWSAVRGRGPGPSLLRGSDSRAKRKS